MKIRSAVLLVVFVSASALADPAGTWNIRANATNGMLSSVLTINSDGSGEIRNMMGTTAFTDAKIDGDKFEVFVVADTPLGSMEISYVGEVDGDTVSGELTDSLGVAPFTGTRQAE